MTYEQLGSLFRTSSGRQLENWMWNISTVYTVYNITYIYDIWYMTIYTVFNRLWFSTKKHCESPETRNIDYHRYHKNIRYHWYHKKWNTSHEKGTISKRRVRLVPKHLHVKVIKLFQPWGDRLWQFGKHPLCHLGGKNERKTNLFGRIIWFCVFFSLYSTYFTLDLVNAVPNVRVQSLHLFFLQPKLPEPGTEYHDEDQTHIPANLNKRAQSRRHRPALDSIAVSLFGNMTVDTREIHIITKECQYQNKWSK